MILFFSDLHLGIKSYSFYDKKGITTAEYEGRKALEAIYKRASSPDITMIIFGGDFFHTNHPTSENIAFAIEWIKKMDSLNKPFYLITGNHDCTDKSNGLRFIDKLSVKNTFLLDSIEDVNRTVKWNNWNIVFIPYLTQDSSLDKDTLLHTVYENKLSLLEDNSIVISHLQETSCKMGSEAIMINRGVELLDMASVHSNKNLLLLLGHIHRYQQYKKGHATICYPGNTFYHDSSDRNQAKGYTLISEEGVITFEPIEGLRKFFEIQDFSIPRITLKDQVLFFKMSCSKDIKVQLQIEELAKKHEFIIGNIYFTEDITEEQNRVLLERDSEPNLIQSCLADPKIKIPEHSSVEELLQISLTYLAKDVEKYAS